MTKWDEAWEAWDDVEMPKAESTAEVPDVEIKPKGKGGGLGWLAAIALVILAIVYMSGEDSKPTNTGSTFSPVKGTDPVTLPPPPVNRPGPVTLPEGTWQPPSYSEQKKRTLARSTPPAPSARSKPSETLVATWEINLGPGFMGLEEKFIYHDGKMVLRRKYPDGSWGTQELIERPAKNSGERKFATEEGARSEYFTLSGDGRVKHFDWDGAQFAAAKATFVASNAMSIGSNVQARSCVPRQLSAAATQFVRLHKELHAFKNNPQFALVGFAQGFPYSDWLERAESLGASLQPVQLAFMEETGFFMGDLWELGWVYMTTADDDVISQEDSDYITGMERIIRTGIAIAKCGE